MIPFKITFQPNTARSRHLRYHVVQGRGDARTSVSAHRKLHRAVQKAQRWKAPAHVVVLDRETGEAHDPFYGGWQ